ncbi:MAG: hypothetical protein JST22_07760 [Bacteroidetes bacterium]|nr:hypothetical protein [Bacteroidota bacterium]
MKRFLVPALPLLILLASACGDKGPRLDEQGHPVDGTPEADIEVASPTFSVLNILRATGNKVRVTGKVSRPFFGDAKGNAIEVNQAIEMELYEFATKADLEKVAASISPDGGSVNGEAVSWSGSPHMYKTDRVIIIYFGDGIENMKQLTAAFGSQFAGKPVPGIL